MITIKDGIPMVEGHHEVDIEDAWIGVASRSRPTSLDAMESVAKAFGATYPWVKFVVCSFGGDAPFVGIFYDEKEVVPDNWCAIKIKMHRLLNALHLFAGASYIHYACISAQYIGEVLESGNRKVKILYRKS